jgi:hypothetical protein
LLPSATRFAVLVNPNNPLAETGLKDAQAWRRRSDGKLKSSPPTLVAIDAAFDSCKSGSTRF